MEEHSLAVRVGAQAAVGYVCEDCEAVIGPHQEIEPLYECGACGMRFTRDQSADGMSHRCPECHLFSGLVTPFGCPECSEGELEQVLVVCCPVCEEYCEEAAFEDHWAEEGHEDEQ